MNSPDKASCINGSLDNSHGKGFAGMRKMCSNQGGALARDIPWLYLIWNRRNREAARFPGAIL